MIKTIMKYVDNMNHLYKVIRMNPNPNEFSNSPEYKQFQKYGDLDFNDIVKTIINSKYKSWLTSTITNKVSTKRKLLTLKNRLDEDRAYIMEVIIRNRLAILFKKCKDIPTKLNNLNAYNNYTIKSYHLIVNDLTFPLYNKNNYTAKTISDSQMFFSNTILNNIYSPVFLNGRNMFVIDFSGRINIFKTVRFRIFNYNYVFENDEELKEYNNEEGNNYNFSPIDMTDISYLDIENEDYNLDLLSSELKYFFDIDVRHIYTLTKDGITFTDITKKIVKDEIESSDE